MDTKKIRIGNDEIGININKFAKQADSSVMINYGDTYVLVTVVASKRESNFNFFPLIVNYDEKLYATGKIPGNYGRREARPSTNATLAARLIDRPIRPLFPEGYKNEVQVVCTVMSYDPDFEPDILSITGSSLALMLNNNIPFSQPVAGVCIGLIDGEFIINPSVKQKKISSLEIKMSGTLDAINMVEAEGEEVSEEIMIEGLMLGHNEIKKIVTWQNEIILSNNIVKEEFILNIDPLVKEMSDKILNNFKEEMETALKNVKKQDRSDAMEELKEEIKETFMDLENEFQNKDLDINKSINNAFEELEKNIFRKLIIKDKYRVDGRTTTMLRELNSEIDILPRTHGSALFTRGETQSLGTVTLGLKSDEQSFDGFETIKEKPFMLHYNFPPYSVGETGRMGAPGRREIGHGNLAEMALSKVLPNITDFPYAIRVVSEILESNGSSSQATICSGSLALMAAGVPIKKHVAGIAMGLIADEKEHTILTDIQGLEDHLGDMDFKVAGTRDGICTIQMDIKISGINKEILTNALQQAKIARHEILDNMEKIIAIPKKELSVYAPKTKSIKISENQIKIVIGKGGETINKIIDQTGVKIDIEEDGTVFIYSENQQSIEDAIEYIERLTKTYKVEERYMAKVVRIESFGAFVRFEDQDALLHISDLSEKRVEKVEDVLALNDTIEVEIKEIDKQKRIKVKLVLNKGE